MRDMRRALDYAGRLRHRYQVRWWFLRAVRIYGDAVRQLADDLADVRPDSTAFGGLRDYLAAYVRSQVFARLAGDADRVTARLSAVRYTIRVKGGRVSVARYAGEADYSAQVLDTFATFRQEAAKDHRFTFREHGDLDTVEERVLDLVARLFPDEFAALDALAEQHRDYPDPVVRDFDREVQFYLAYLAYVRPLRAAGLPFCYPVVSAGSKQVRAGGVFDLPLAAKLVGAQRPVVGNDLELRGPERILVVTGPNQGGKTTFARTFGQLHYLARLGLPVPGEHAELYLYDRMFTHFERPEQAGDLRGKLQDELVRLREILDRASSDSIIVANEIFTSTSLADALLLGRRLIGRLSDLDALCVYVTFVDELASATDKTVSMVATVAEDDPATRTFRLVRRPADGLAYATVLADRYGLTYQRLADQVARS
jgi:DNA mismatch repair ATPase MutS